MKTFSKGRWYRMIRLGIGLALTLLAFMGCGESHGPDGPTGQTAESLTYASASFTIQWRDDLARTRTAASLDCAAEGVATVRCEVYDQGGEWLASGGPWSCSTGGGRVTRIRSGPDRIFVILAEDTQNLILWKGQVEGIDLEPGEANDVGEIEAFRFTPSLLTPAHDESLDPDVVSLTWAAVTHATAYHVLVATEATFAADTLRADGVSPGPVYAFSSQLPDTTYYWTVYALDGFGNQGAASETRTFHTNSCWVSITPLQRAFDNSGGGSAIAVAAPAACSWQSSTDADWIAISAGSGSGAGTVSYSVVPNLGTSARMATIAVTGNDYTVVQSARPCTTADYAILPVSSTFSSDGGAGRITVTTSASCGWTAASSAVWISIGTSGGIGNGTVSFAVAPNPDTSQRTATITIAGIDHPVTQSGRPCTAADYTLLPVSSTFPYDGGAGSITVTTFTDCGWAAATSAGWITISAGSGSGGGAVRYAATANPDPITRTAIITIAGNDHTVTQSGRPCIAADYAISPVGSAFAAAGGSGSIAVTATSGCAWTTAASVDWITIIAGGGNGDGRVSYSVAQNPEFIDRSAAITVAGIDHLVSQEHAPCDYDITIGDNDGYGYGATIVPDTADLPTSDDPEHNWIFDQRDASEINATDGAQYTDYEPYADMRFSFTIRFCPLAPADFYFADFTLDVSGIQQSFGPAYLYLDGVDFSDYLPDNQGTFGSDLIYITIDDPSLFTDGEMEIEFIGAPFPDPDAIAFDYFRLFIYWSGVDD